MATLTLKVAEGRPLDAGRGLARLDPSDLARLSATPGSVIQVTARRTAAVKAMPAFRDLRGRQLVQIDGLTRSNAGAAIGEQVMLSVVDPPAAERVVLAPEGAQVLRQLSDETVCRALSDVPVVAGDLPPIRELVENGVTGRLVPEGDVDALARTLAELASDPDARARLARRGRLRVEAEFSMNANAARLAQALREATPP